jgi:vitamin B12 transporter
VKAGIVLRAPALAAAAFFLAGPARAQEPAPEEGPQKGLSSQILVSSRLDEADPTATVRVVTREEIESLPVRSVPELLSALPGLDVRRRGPEGMQADVGIRGSDFNGTLVLVDGMPVNDPQSNHLSMDLDVPLDGVERVEVLYGGASALYGSEAVGGVVNIVTRGGDLGRSRMQCETRYSHGSSSLDAGGYRAAMRMGDMMSFAVDMWRSESSGFRDDTEFQHDAIRVSGRWDTGRGPVDASFGFADRRYGAYDFYGTSFPNQQETTVTRSGNLRASLDAGGGWRLVPALSIRSHHDDYVLDRNDPSFYENLHDTDRYTATITARRPLWGGSLAVGGEAGREVITSTNLGHHARNHGALFLEYGRPFDASAPGLGAFRIGLRGDTDEGFGSRLSPRAGLSFAPVAGLRLRASTGTSFRVPTYTELYYVDPQNVGNPGLRPEKSVTAEAGASVDMGPLTLDGVFFWRHGTDLIDYVRSSTLEPYRAGNIRTVNTSGVEATLELRRPKGSTLTRLAVQTAYVFANLADLSAAAGGATQGKYVLDPLHVKWDLIAGAALPAIRVSGNTRVSYFARPSFAGGVWLWEARLGYHVFQGEILEFYAEGHNLGNSHDEEIPGVPLPGRTWLAGFHLTW